MRQQRSGAHASHRIITCLSHSCTHAALCCPPHNSRVFVKDIVPQRWRHLFPRRRWPWPLLFSVPHAQRTPQGCAAPQGTCLSYKRKMLCGCRPKHFVSENTCRNNSGKKTSCKPQSRSSGHWRHSPRMNTLVRGRTCQAAACHMCLSTPRIPWRA